jgi:hypothetical protein
MYITESSFKGNELTTIFDEIIKTVKTENPRNSAESVEAFAIYQPQQQISTNLPVIVNSLTRKSDQSISLVTSSNNNNHDKNANNVVHRLIFTLRGAYER